MATIIKEEGITAFWSGIAPTIAGAIPFEGAQFVKSALGAISQTLAFPFDVVRKGKLGGEGLTINYVKIIPESGLQETIYGGTKMVGMNCEVNLIGGKVFYSNEEPRHSNKELGHEVKNLSI
jgi:hypothetical protein